MIFNAQDLCHTRLCHAQNCGDDAMSGWVLCERHERQHRRGYTITLHEEPARLQDTLRCSGCGDYKIDEDFARARDNPHRRMRHQECKACSAQRRLIRTRNRKRIRTPEQKARNAALTKIRRDRLKAELDNVRATLKEPEVEPK